MKNIVVLGILCALFLSPYLGVTGHAEEEAEYKLTITADRSDNTGLENPFAVYQNGWMGAPEPNPVFDREEWGLKSFDIEYELHIEGRTDTITKVFHYEKDSYTWKSVHTYEGIEVPYEDIEIQYVAEEGKEWVDAYLLHYDLYLSKGDGKMILKVPKIFPDAVRPPKGDEKVLRIKTSVEEDLTGKILYLNGKSGEDAKDGTTPENAVKTFDKIKELIAKNPKIKKVFVTGKVEVEGEVSLTGKKAKIYRAADYKGDLFVVPSGKNAVFKDITIDGNSEEAKNTEGSLIRTYDGATITIADGAVIRNNDNSRAELHNRNEKHGIGAGIRAQGTHVIMTGGVVEENTANDGGGICLFESRMDFTGGVVRNNRALRVLDHSVKPAQTYSAGGGILAYYGSTVNMSGAAQIRNNRADECGGGISLGSRQWSTGNAVFRMNGGIIDGNEAGAAGGGIFIQAKYVAQAGTSTAIIEAGMITNNKMTNDGVTEREFGGGGIYVNGATGKHRVNGQLILKNAIITENESSWEGAGIAACPISKTVIKVGNGAAIYGNKTNSDGKDIFIYCNIHYGPHSGVPEYELPHHMLGGIPYYWKLKDGTPLPDGRYAGKITENDTALMLYTDSVASDFTKALAKVWITGNTSNTRGGGIGSNGDVSIGDDTPSTDIKVEKKWHDAGKDNTRPEKVIVKLMARIGTDPTEYVVEARELSKANDWKTIFKNLPTMNGDQPITYSVKEEPVAGYQTRITGNAKDGFVITNKPDTPPPTPTEEKIDIPVEKIWKDNGYEDKRPAEIHVTLYADGIATDNTLVLNAANNWKGTFENLPKEKDGKEITYTVKEELIKGYEGTMTGNPHDGFVLTNTYKPEKPPTPPIPPIPFIRIPRAGV